MLVTITFLKKISTVYWPWNYFSIELTSNVHFPYVSTKQNKAVQAEGIHHTVFIWGFWLSEQLENKYVLLSPRSFTPRTVNEFIHKDKERGENQQPETVGSQKETQQIGGWLRSLASQAGERECQPATSVCTVKLLGLEDYLYRVPVKREVKAKKQQYWCSGDWKCSFYNPLTLHRWATVLAGRRPELCPSERLWSTASGPGEFFSTPPWCLQSSYNLMTTRQTNLPKQCMQALRIDPKPLRASVLVSSLELW